MGKRVERWMYSCIEITDWSDAVYRRVDADCKEKTKQLCKRSVLVSD